MARLKAATELETLQRQQVELAKRIKEAQAKSRLKEKADAERRELMAGRILLAHLAAHPQSTAATSIIAILEAAPLKAADRALFAAFLSPTRHDQAEGDTAKSSNSQAAAE